MEKPVGSLSHDEEMKLGARLKRKLDLLLLEEKRWRLKSRAV